MKDSLAHLYLDPGRHHTIWKEWKRVGKGKEPSFFLEHRQAVLESLPGPHPPKQVLLARELRVESPEFWDDLARRYQQHTTWFLVDGESLERVASVPTSGGVSGHYDPAPTRLEDLLALDFLMLLWDLADPGNLGTLLRACQALTGGGVVAVGGCTPWSAKVARASVGSLLKMPLVHLPEQESSTLLGSLREAGFTVRGALPRATEVLQEVLWSGKDAVVLGNETRGLPADLVPLLVPFRIPTENSVESLNVAMAGSIIAWEWRKFGKISLGQA